LFSVARRYGLTLQPQLILLQKTLLNIEGVGRLLHPKIDIWATAKPVLADILRQRYSVRRLFGKLRNRLPEWVAAAPEMPQLVHEFLKKAAAGDFDTSRAIDAAAHSERGGARMTARVWLLSIMGATALFGAALLYALNAPGPRIGGQPLSAVVAALIGAGSFIAAWRRTR
jgi:ubiquinone biosynthesis protein